MIPCLHQKSYFIKDIEKIFFELLKSSTNQQQQVKSIACKTKQILRKFLIKTCLKQTNNVETYILGDFSVNLWQGHYVFQKLNLLSCQSVQNNVKNYFDFCTMFDLKQLIESPTQITHSSSSITDHILASFTDKSNKMRGINVRLSDHQLIYCTI